MVAQENYIKMVNRYVQRTTGQVSNKIDGLSIKVQHKIGGIIHDSDGKTRKTKSTFGTKCTQTIDGAGQMVEWAVGDVTNKMLGALNAVQTEANFLQQRSDQVTQSIMGPIHSVEAGIISATTTGIGHQIGMSTAGMTFNGAVSIQFNPGTCGNMGKLVKDTLKLIGIAQKLIKKLKFAKIVPGLGSLLKQVNKLGKIAVPCLDISASSNAAIDSRSVLPSPSAPSPVTWDIIPDPPANQTTT